MLIPQQRQAFFVGSNFKMTQPSSIIKFVGIQRDKVLSELVSVDKELKDFFKKYIHEEYKGDNTKRLDYIDIGFIARFIVDKLKNNQTEIFPLFFAKVETILNDCDDYINDLIVVGLFESIQNICGTEIDYHYVFNPWLKKLSKLKWDKLIDSWEGEEWKDKYKDVF